MISGQELQLYWDSALEEGAHKQRCTATTSVKCRLPARAFARVSVAVNLAAPVGGKISTGKRGLTALAARLQSLIRPIPFAVRQQQKEACVFGNQNRVWRNVDPLADIKSLSQRRGFMTALNPARTDGRRRAECFGSAEVRKKGRRTANSQLNSNGRSKSYHCSTPVCRSGQRRASRFNKLQHRQCQPDGRANDAARAKRPLKRKGTRPARKPEFCSVAMVQAFVSGRRMLLATPRRQ